MSFAEANKKVHSVETQWHHPILVARGFIPETKEAVGLVRSYAYTHSDGRSVRCVTGLNRDYFELYNPDGTEKIGLWSDLESSV